MTQTARNPSDKEGRISTISTIKPKTGGLLNREPEYQAYQILHFGFVVAPIVAGLDKFSDLLVNWDNYLAPVVTRVLGIAPHTFMQAAGVIEIVAGIGIALKPKIFGYVVSAWLLGIVMNLLMTGQYFDIALRDFGLSLGALALARLSTRYDGGQFRRQA
jgi:hypothetical protein